MARQQHVGPVVLPWQVGHPEELAVVVLCGLIGAVIGSTVMHHYRRRDGRA